MPGAPSPRAASTAPPVDHAITGRIAAGDEAAFARFYEAWFEPTLALARACSRRDEQWCLDVVQDVMLRVARRMPRLDADEQLRAWMARTVAHAVTDRARSEARRSRREQLAHQRDAAPSSEPWLQLAERERRSWLAASVAELPVADRALLEARFGGAGSVAAAAAGLGITSDAAHGRLRRALDKLRQKAAGWWHAS